MLPLIVGEGVDVLELIGVLRLVQAELTAALFSAVLKFSYSDTPYWRYKKHTAEFILYVIVLIEITICC